MNTSELLYDYLLKTIRQKGYPPTVQEIAATCSLEENQLMQSLNHLEREGRIHRLPGKIRSIRITELDWHWYREDQIGRFIEIYLQEHSAVPSFFDIAQASGLSTAMVKDYLSHHLPEVIRQEVSNDSLLATA